MRKLLAKIITEDYGILSNEITGIEHTIQAVQVDVWEANQEAEHHLIVHAYYPQIDRTSCEELETRLNEYFGNLIISFAVNDEPGKAVLFVTPKQQNRASFLSKATATAVVKRSWGWDESKQIRILCETTGECIELKNPEYENGQFEIKV